MKLHLEKKYNFNKFLPELISTIGRENVCNVLFLQLIPLTSSPYLFVSFGGGTCNEHSNANPWFPIDKARNENHWGVRARRVLAQCSWSITRHPRAMSRVRRPLHPLPLPNQTYFFPFFFHLPPTLPSYSLSPASLSTSLFHFHHHDTITLLSPRSSRPRCIHTSSRATRRGTHTWTDVSRTAFSLPFLFLRWGVVLAGGEA